MACEVRISDWSSDVCSCDLEDGAIDSIVSHQGLHVADEPDRVIAERGRGLRGGGHLLVVDLAPHEDEDLRTHAAHARLGFSDAQIRGWFASAGLLLETPQTLAGGQLAVKLWPCRRLRDEQQPHVVRGGARAPKSPAACHRPSTPTPTHPVPP